MRVKSYKVWIEKRDDINYSILNGISEGYVKSKFYKNLKDFLKIKFTDVRVKLLGAPYSSEGFLKNAKYRNLPNLRCGDLVDVNGNLGYVIGYGSSALIEIIFEKYQNKKNVTLFVHPDEIKMVKSL
jgi:hypothetical protein